MNLEDFPVFDIHMHPLLKKELWKLVFHQHYDVKPGSDPFTMRVTKGRLEEGNVRAVFSTIYTLEQELRDSVWFTNAVTNYAMSKTPGLKRFHEMFTGPNDLQCFAQLNSQQEMINLANQTPGRKIEVATSFASYKEIVEGGKTCFINSIEGGHSLEGKLENIDKFSQRGVAHMILAHFYPNAIGGCVKGFPKEIPLQLLGLLTDKYDRSEGLTKFGMDAVSRMFDVGMIVDLTHANHLMRSEVYQIQSVYNHRPVIMSHTGIAEFADYAINATDEDIKQIADSGGVIGLIFMNYWLNNPELKEGMDIIIKSIDYLIDKGGEDCIAFGSDFDGMTGVPSDIKSPSDYNFVRDSLLRHYSEKQVQKFLYTNAERVLEMGWGN